MQKFILTFRGDSEATRHRLVHALLTQFTGSEVALYEETMDSIESIPVPEHPSEVILRQLETELRDNGGLLARQWQDRINTIRRETGCISIEPLN